MEDLYRQSPRNMADLLLSQRKVLNNSFRLPKIKNVLKESHPVADFVKSFVANHARNNSSLDSYDSKTLKSDRSIFKSDFSVIRAKQSLRNDRKVLSYHNPD